MEIALFGGSFDPPHVGHLLAAAYVLATEPVDELWFVPVAEHPLGKPLHAPFEHRAQRLRFSCRNGDAISRAALRRLTKNRFQRVCVNEIGFVEDDETWKLTVIKFAQDSFDGFELLNRARTNLPKEISCRCRRCAKWNKSATCHRRWRSPFDFQRRCK